MADDAVVYAIKDPESGETRYVGSTVDFESRRDQWIGTARRPIIQWLVGVFESGEKPTFEILERGGEEEVRRLEKQCISRLNGSAPLLNERGYGPSGEEEDYVRVRVPRSLYDRAQEAIRDGRLSEYGSVTAFVRDMVRSAIPDGEMDAQAPPPRGPDA